MTSTEHRLRIRIRNAFDLNNASLTQDMIERAENEVLALIRDYAAAPESEKDFVYRQGEERLMLLLRRRYGDLTGSAGSVPA